MGKPALVLDHLAWHSGSRNAGARGWDSLTAVAALKAAISPMCAMFAAISTTETVPIDAVA
jgi:hypothetical protein